MKILLVYKSREERDLWIRRLGVDPNDIEGTKNDKYEKYDIIDYNDLDKDPYAVYKRYDFIRFTYDSWDGHEVNTVLGNYQRNGV